MINFVCDSCKKRAKLNQRDFPLVCLCGARYDSADSVAACSVFVSIQPGGVGRELKDIFKEIDARPSSTCSCEAKAAEMDRLGIESIKANRAKYIDWLKESYTRL